MVLDIFCKKSPFLTNDFLVGDSLILKLVRNLGNSEAKKSLWDREDLFILNLDGRYQSLILAKATRLQHVA